MKVAIFTGAGLGDGLIMMLVAKAFQDGGHEVVIFNDHLGTLFEWCDHFLIKKRPKIADYEQTFQSYHTIVIHHENSEHAKKLAQYSRKHATTYTFYNNYKKNKHPPLTATDFVLNNQKPMLQGVADSLSEIFNKPISKDIGLRLPKRSKKCSKRVVIHPTSAMEEKNWPLKKFIKLAKKLEQKGYEPVFCASPKEKSLFSMIEKKGYIVATTKYLAQLAEVLYDSFCFVGNDSGPAHLASCLHVPTIVISGRKSITHWRPDWRAPSIVSPYPWIPNFKGCLRLRERYWKKWIRVAQVLTAFSYYE